jgi:hypothetical protein
MLGETQVTGQHWRYEVNIFARLNLALSPSLRELEERIEDRRRHETFGKVVQRIHRRT